VVGRQPLLKPGESLQWLASGHGQWHHTRRLRIVAGTANALKVVIPCFVLEASSPDGGSELDQYRVLRD
jgi:uncharacterized protein affecting Mg2+/Co2+ transport